MTKEGQGPKRTRLGVDAPGFLLGVVAAGGDDGFSEDAAQLIALVQQRIESGVLEKVGFGDKPQPKIRLT